MSVENPKYDVAISFLFPDANIAEELARKLGEIFDVFFFPDRQEDLAGTEGMESMRTPFYEDSRVNVVLYRDGWGGTRWTAIEERAIKDACFNGGWYRLFFLMLDRKSTIPKWLPDTPVRYDLEVFGLDGAAGAIKARVLENLGKPKPMTPAKQAALLKADEDFCNERREMLSGSSHRVVEGKVEELFQEMAKHCDEVNLHGSIDLRHGLIRRGTVPESYILSDGSVGLLALWRPPRVSSETGEISVQEYNSRLYPPPEKLPQVRIHGPKLLKKSEYEPDISRAREYGWKEKGSKDFTSTNDLAGKCVLAFLKIVQRRSSGELEGPKIF